MRILSYSRVSVKDGLVMSERLPGSMEVVGHKMNEVNSFCKRRHVIGGVDGWLSGRYSYS